MALPPPDWHARYQQQARWTQNLRAYLYQRAGLASARRVLEVGCGTGILLAELQSQAGLWVCGVDLAGGSLRLAARHAPAAALTRGDALALPYPPGHFDLALCHFLLLWAADPLAAVMEMKRVTRPGGAVLALAEPDYGGRIDYPEELAVLGLWQAAALRRSGADPRLGRRLGEIFTHAGLKTVEVGVLGGLWSGPPGERDWELEWSVLQSDLHALIRSPDSQESQNGQGQPGIPEPNPARIASLRARDRAAWERGERILFVPTFYAWGQVA